MTTETTTSVEENPLAETPPVDAISDFLPQLDGYEIRRVAKAQMDRAAAYDVREQRQEAVKRVEQAVAIWYATTKGWCEQICTTTRSMINQIRSEPDCILASIISEEELDKFDGEFSDASTRLSDVYPLIGKKLINPTDVDQDQEQDEEQDEDEE
jgi:hypothetical protein